MSDPPDRLPSYPMRRTCPFAPAPGYRKLREHPEISQVRMPTGLPAWAVTRYGDVRSMLSDPRFSSNMRDPGFPLLAEHMRPTDAFDTSLIGMDAPEHTAARRAVAGEFTVRRAKTLRPRIQRIVDDHLDRMLAGPKPADLVEALAFPVPLLVICELLGVPNADRDLFQRCSSLLMDGDSPEQAGAALGELLSYLDRLVTEKEREPGDDLLGRQIRRRGQPGVADHKGLVELAFMLLMAGHEAPANIIALGTVALLEHPDQLAPILADAAGIPNAVEELIRYFTIAEVATSRVATDDVGLGDVTIRAGEGVLGLISGANRDPEVFDDPDELLLDRAGARNHLGFGFGSHQCLGQNLARLELQTVFEALFLRVPGLRLAVPFGELRFKDDSINYGLHALPVTW
ncbi:cytochrome P450 [Streptosporangium sp. NPDC051023]|uniref:cytochrome P450 n=1 Tax=Streptosporangium sp. NPDC051023 TaxID=3155410 RepID=UPI00344C657E